MEGISTNERATKNLVGFFVLSIIIIPALSFTAVYSYLLFHALIEIFSVVVAFSLFIVVWNTEDLAEINIYRSLGYSYLFIAFIDTLHTLSYKGMGVFPGYDANLPTQLWIFARYLESLSFLLAPVLTNRKLSRRKIMAGFLFVTTIFLVAIFTGLFPAAFIEGSGLTIFKILSEYVIVGILVAALYFYYSGLPDLHEDSKLYLLSAIITTILAELSFTLYVDVYGIFNMLGHYLKLLSFYLIYRGTVAYTLQDPISSLFSNLKQNERSLLAANEGLKLSQRIMQHDVRNSLHRAKMQIELLQETEEIVHREHALQSIEGAIQIIEDAEKIGTHVINNEQRESITLSTVLQYIPYQERVNVEGDCTVLAGPGIASVLYNLIENSIKHGSATNIKITLESKGDLCVITVEDNGTGISEELHHTIFEKGVSGLDAEGSGMGLYIAREVVHLYDGKISLMKSDSNSTVFEIQLPSAKTSNQTKGPNSTSSQE